MSQSTYSVYLVERGDSGGKRQVTSPVEGYDLEFYDTGVWLDRKMGRNFFPYEQIRTIREHPAETSTDPERERATDRIEQGVEGDTGAEEELLEE